jgi:formate dehydrogenase subunit gamma
MNGGKTIVRYNFVERSLHALAGISFVYLLLTGLAFWTPGLFWIAEALGGGFLSRLLHPWAGVVFFGFVIWMLLIWSADMRTTDADRAWRKALARYARNEDLDVPATGRFNYGQKMFFWGMLWATVLLLVSGVVLWFPNSLPGNAGWLREVAIVTHALSSLVAIGLFIVHVYMGVAVVPGSVHAVIHGDVTSDWARHHHRLWADELAGRSTIPPTRVDRPR